MDAIGGKEKSSRGLFGKFKKKFKIGGASSSYEVHNIDVISVKKYTKDNVREGSSSLRRQETNVPPPSEPDASKRTAKDTRAVVKERQQEVKTHDASKRTDKNLPLISKEKRQETQANPSKKSGDNNLPLKNVENVISVKDNSETNSKQPSHPNAVPTATAVNSANKSVVDDGKLNLPSEVVGSVGASEHSKVENDSTSCETQAEHDVFSNGTDKPSEIHQEQVREVLKADTDLVEIRGATRLLSDCELKDEDEEILTGSSLHHQIDDSCPEPVGMVSDGGTGTPCNNDTGTVPNVVSLQQPDDLSIYDTASPFLITKTVPPDVEGIYDSVDVSQLKKREESVPLKSGGNAAPVSIDITGDENTVDLDEHVNFRAAKSKWAEMEKDSSVVRQGSKKRMGNVFNSGQSNHPPKNSERSDVPSHTDVHTRMRMFENKPQDGATVKNQGARPKEAPQSKPVEGAHVSPQVAQRGKPTRQRRSREEIFEVCNPDLVTRNSGSSTEDGPAQIVKQNVAPEASPGSKRLQRKRVPTYEDVDLDQVEKNDNNSESDNCPQPETEEILPARKADGDYEELDLDLKPKESLPPAENRRSNRRKHVPSYEDCFPDLEASENKDEGEENILDSTQTCDSEINQNLEQPLSVKDSLTETQPPSRRQRVKRVPSYEDCDPFLDSAVGTESAEKVEDDVVEEDPDAIYAISHKRNKTSRSTCKPGDGGIDVHDDSDRDSGSDDDMPPVPSRGYQRTPSLIQKFGLESTDSVGGTRHDSIPEDCDAVEKPQPVQNSINCASKQEASGASNGCSDGSSELDISNLQADTHSPSCCHGNMKDADCSNGHNGDQNTADLSSTNGTSGATHRLTHSDDDEEETHFRLEDLGIRTLVLGETVSESESISSRRSSTEVVHRRRHSTGGSEQNNGTSIPRTARAKITSVKSLTLPARPGSYHQPDETVDVIQSLLRLKDCGWYWGPLSYEDAESKLADRPDGSFLVRDSSDDRYILSLSFRALGRTQHTRIEHFKGLFSFHSQPATHAQTTIVDFIEKAMQHSKDGRFLYFIRPTARGSPPVPVQLIQPVSRFKMLMSLQHLCRFLILKAVRHDHIDKLPLPQMMKDYLREQQYYAEYLDDCTMQSSDSGDD